jgi:hypothetical protein
MLGYEELENGIRSVLQPMSCMQPKQQHFFLHQLQVQHPRKSTHKILRKCMYIRRKQQNKNMKIRNKERNYKYGWPTVMFQELPNKLKK